MRPLLKLAFLVLAAVGARSMYDRWKRAAAPNGDSSSDTSRRPPDPVLVAEQKASAPPREIDLDFERVEVVSVVTIGAGDLDTGGPGTDGREAGGSAAEADAGPAVETHDAPRAIQELVPTATTIRSYPSRDGGMDLVEVLDDQRSVLAMAEGRDEERALEHLERAFQQWGPDEP